MINITQTKDLLAIYLTDHYAGALAGSRRMRRLADAERLAADGQELAEIADQIDEDRQTLSAVLGAAGVQPRWYKTSVAWLAERAGLLKTNGRIVQRSPLTSLVELEGMCMAVTGKKGLWSTLAQSDLAHNCNFDDLLLRADEQLRGLEAAHRARISVIAPRSPSNTGVDVQS